MSYSITPLLQANEICVYHRAGGQKRLILDHVSLTLKRGQITTIVGPNGAGKTTLIKVILGLIQPDTGKVRVEKNLKIGYMPQKIGLNPLMPMSVQRFLQLASPKSNYLLRDRIMTYLKQVGANHLAENHLSELSGGELQRIMLAFAMMQSPNLLILDEPDQGIDVLGQAELYHLINQIRLEQGCAVLLVSHDLHTVMAASDEVICLNGHVCCSGHPDIVQQDPTYHQLFGQYIHHHDHRHDHTRGETLS
ncbi:MAG TPA: metal ABC transporter ATP-binding protein [Candidatus Nitrosotenuis sp.]|jgi:zinc transport system ATP-binding protein|nr:metal ABC transporter ATP-binding protein [Candidatus Nitrosotenuis sp.]